VETAGLSVQDERATVRRRSVFWAVFMGDLVHG
jgi:hypothetical protein